MLERAHNINYSIYETKSFHYGGGKNTFAIKLVQFVPFLVQDVLFQSHSRPILEHMCSNVFRE